MARKMEDAVVRDVGFTPMNGAVIFLGRAAEKDGSVLPIFVEPAQAFSLQLGRFGIRGGRPLAHDLLCDILRALGVTVERVTIDELTVETFYASLYLKGPHDAQPRRLDARPSDALPIAARMGAPVQVASELIERQTLQARDIPGFESGSEEPDKEALLEDARGLARADFTPQHVAAGGPGLVDVDVDCHLTNWGPTVFFTPKGDQHDRVVPMPVDITAATHLRISLYGELSPRPLTPDLISAVLNEFGAIVERTIVEDVDVVPAKPVFYASLYVEVENEEGVQIKRFDARPSDCIALAVRVGAPIQLAARVVAQASIPRKDLGPLPVTDDEPDDLGVSR